jgi:hypothetical protein
MLDALRWGTTRFKDCKCGQGRHGPNLAPHQQKYGDQLYLGPYVDVPMEIEDYSGAFFEFKDCFGHGQQLHGP